MRFGILIRSLFGVAALYDGLLGAGFLFFGQVIFEHCEVAPPNHAGYIHFPAALLLVFGLMFLAIARAPERNHNLIPYGILLKISYCGVVLFHWVREDVPFMWKPFWVADLLFLAGFIWAWTQLRQSNSR